MNKKIFKLGFINYLNDSVELNFFIKLILNLNLNVSQNIDLYIASSVQPREKFYIFSERFHKVYFYTDFKSNEFQEIIKTFDLGIVPSQLKNIISLSSIEFLKNDVPILCGDIGGDCELSKSRLFRFNNENDFYIKLTDLYTTPQLLSEYKKNYSDVTEQFIQESVADRMLNI